MKKIILVSSLFSALILTSGLNADDKTTAVVVGIQTSFGGATQTFSNQTNTTDYDFTLNGYKLLVGSDVDLFGIGETSRFYGSYKYSTLGTESMNTFGIGYMENMTYLSFYEEGEQAIYPFTGLELGYGSVSDFGGINTQVDLGIAYKYENMELTLAYTYNYTNLGETAGKSAVYMNSNQATFGFNYKFMSEGK